MRPFLCHFALEQQIFAKRVDPQVSLIRQWRQS